MNPKPYLILAFEDDNAATAEINKRANEGYRLVGVSSAAVSSKENYTWPLVLRIVVTMQYVGNQPTAKPNVDACRH